MLEDISLFQTVFLPKVHEGIDTNQIPYRCLAHLLWSNACPAGMGSFSMNMGHAWRFKKIPSNFQDTMDNKYNWLEFLASLITIWLEVLYRQTLRESCLLTLGDNSPAVGWLHKVNVDKETSKPLQMMTRHLASILTEAKCCIYSQHFRGINNNMADVLSHEHHLTDTDLIKSIHTHFPHQAPKSLAILPLPPNVSSWVTCLLQSFSKQRAIQKVCKRKRSEYGKDGDLTSRVLSLTLTHFSKSFVQPQGQDSLVPLLQHCNGEPFCLLVKVTCQAAQSKRPWQNWLRSIGQTWGTIPTMEKEPMVWGCTKV